MSDSIPGAFYITGGTLQNDARSYVRRAADDELYERLAEGEFCYVLTARQMGKSSLMVRTAAELRKNGASVAVLDLTALGQNLSVEQWYYGLLEQVGHSLNLEDELGDDWLAHPEKGPLQRWMSALRDIALPHIMNSPNGKSAPLAGRLILFVDEIDVVQSLPFSTDEFFAAIRECYNRRTMDPALSNLSFCLLGVATPSDLIQDVRMTPFNIGRRIELLDFSSSEAAVLIEGLGTSRPGRDARQAAAMLRRVLYWTGGHPYLTQRLCQAVAAEESVKDSAGVDRLCRDLFLSSRSRERDDNLLFVRDRLLRSEEDRAGLLDLYAKVRRRPGSVRDDESNPIISVLRLSGIVSVLDGALQVRNRIYHQVFDGEWIAANMPGAELQRQRAAYHRGLLRASAIAAIIVACMGALAGLAYVNGRAAHKNLIKANRNAATAHTNLIKANQNAAEAGRNASEARRNLILATHSAAEANQNAKRANSEKLKARASAAVAEQKTLEARWNLNMANTNLSLANQRQLKYLSAAHDAEKARRNAEAARSRAVSMQGQATAAAQDAREKASSFRHLLYITDMNLIQQAWESTPSQVNRVLELLDETRTKTPEYCGFEWGYWWRLCHQDLMTLKAEPVLSVAFSPDGKRLASGSNDNTVRIWDAQSGRETLTLKGHTGYVYTVAFSPDGKRLASGSGDNTVRIWDAQTGREKLTLKGHTDHVETVAFSPDGKRLASGSDDGTIKIWDAQTSREMLTLKGHTAPVTSVAFSPHGKRLASGSYDATIKIWDAQTGRKTLTLEGHPAPVYTVAFSPDGKRLASGSGDNTVRIWDAQTGREMLTLKGHTAPVTSVAFSPDGKRLASGSFDATIEIWDAQTGRETLTLKGHTGYISSVAFSPDGKRLASGSSDDTIKIWYGGAPEDVDGGRRTKDVKTSPQSYHEPSAHHDE